VWSIAALAIGLRVASLGWNDRLQGDVNLFALTAREVARNGRLVYPMRYEYSDHVPYLSFETPATQHPPLWPFSAGLLARALGSDDTFAVLKGLSFVAGLLLLWSVLRIGRGRAAWLLALLFMAVSPLLVDYSANGSPYAAIALALLRASWLLARLEPERLGAAAGAGVLASLTVQAHGMALFLPLAFGVPLLLRRAFRATFVFAATGTLVALPFVVWNMRTFGSPFYSNAPHFLWMKLGLVTEGLSAGRVTLLASGVNSGALLASYGTIVWANLVELAKGVWGELGPFCLLLCAAGALRLWASAPRAVRAGAVVYGVVAATMVLWGTVRLTRFLVPLLPALLVLAGVGAVWLWHRGRAQAWAAGVLVIGTIGFDIPAYFERPPTRYYVDDANYAEDYRRMRSLAAQLAKLPPGPVLGYSMSLDGGIETVYFHRFPFVRGRRFDGSGLLDPEVLQRLVHDFGVRYVWVDTATRRDARHLFRDATPRLRNARYAVLELPVAEAAARANRTAPAAHSMPPPR
jgi:hypothetical protein